MSGRNKGIPRLRIGAAQPPSPREAAKKARNRTKARRESQRRNRV